MLAVAFLVAAGALGLALAWSVPARLTVEERVAIGVPVGLAAAASGTFVLALAMGLSDGTVALATVAALAGAVLLARRPPARERASAEWADAGRRVARGELTAFAVVLAACGAVLAFVFWQVLHYEGEMLRALPDTAWGDWQVHLGQTTSFAYTDNVPPEAHTMAGVRLPYPFLVNFLSAILLESGMGLLPAMKLAAAILAVSGVAMLMVLTRQLAGPRAALLAPPLFYLAGGLGWIDFLSDVADGANLGLLRRYTLIEPFEPGRELVNLQWANPTFTYLVPQRSFLFGLPLVLACVALVFHARRERSRGTMLAAGLVAALLPLVHTHGLVALGMVGATLLVLGLRGSGVRGAVREWLPLAAPAIVLALPITLWLTSAAGAGGEVRLDLGWRTRDDFWPWFWLKNTGVFIPAVLAGVLLHRRRHPYLGAAAVSAGTIFVACNLVAFQQGSWDNTKLFAYAYALAVPAAAAFVVWLTRRGAAATVAAALVVVSLTFAGALDASHTLLRSYAVDLFDPQSRALASAIQDETEPDALFVTGHGHPNEIHVLAGRATLLGPTGWPRSWGIDISERLADVKRIYRGGPAAERLLRRFGVDYVAVGPLATHRGYLVNEPWFSSRFALRWRSDDQRVYDVRAVSRRASARARG